MCPVSYLVCTESISSTCHLSYSLIDVLAKENENMQTTGARIEINCSVNVYERRNTQNVQYVLSSVVTNLETYHI